MSRVSGFPGGLYSNFHCSTLPEAEGNQVSLLLTQGSGPLHWDSCSYNTSNATSSTPLLCPAEPQYSRMPNEIIQVLGTPKPWGTGEPSVVGNPISTALFYSDHEGRGLHHDWVWYIQIRLGRRQENRWEIESESHVNYLELMGTFLAL